LVVILTCRVERIVDCSINRQSRAHWIVEYRASKGARKTERNSPNREQISQQRNGYTQARERERVSLERFEQARKRERQRATVPSATKRIENEREKWI
jgi:hypothetical protein